MISQRQRMQIQIINSDKQRDVVKDKKYYNERRFESPMLQPRKIQVNYYLLNKKNVVYIYCNNCMQEYMNVYKYISTKCA